MQPTIAAELLTRLYLGSRRLGNSGLAKGPTKLGLGYSRPMLKASQPTVRWEGNADDFPTQTLTQVQVQECLATDCCFESNPINTSTSLQLAEIMMGHKSLKAILIATLLHLVSADEIRVDPYEFSATSRGKSSIFQLIHSCQLTV